MSTEFSRALSLLRQEKGVSQRIASKSLGVSQALLSHYENGAREPGLKFLAKACDYYDVTADFLIGRTMMRDSMGIQPEILFDASADKDNRLRGSAAAVMSKRLLCNSISLLFDILGRAGHRGLISAALRYFSAAFYKVFRLVFVYAGRNPSSFFSIHESFYSPACDSELFSAEASMRAILAKQPRPGMPVEEPPVLPEISNETLNSEYPMLVGSLFSVLHQVGEQIKGK